METRIEELGKEIEHRREWLAKESQEVQAVAEKIKHEQAYLKCAMDSLKMKQQDLKTELSANEKLQKEIQKLSTKIQHSEDDIAKYMKQMNERIDQLKHYDQGLGVAKEKMEKLLQESPWIRAEEAFFGKEGTMYSFAELEPLKLQEELEEMELERDDLKKKFPTNVDELAQKNQEMYTELDRKRTTIKADKEKLEEMMSIFDRERNKDIKATVKEVSKSLGEIFSTLLKGVVARLHPICDAEQENAIVGLELKVAFNGVEKESLSELSGGQKSLLALSLILALLKYQPAPFYILDEIDSALDLSHTQNIGLMIKKYFKSSQFLIVSLKQGLFQNANVLFQVSFQENRSMVKRLNIRKNQGALAAR